MSAPGSCRTPLLPASCRGCAPHTGSPSQPAFATTFLGRQKRQPAVQPQLLILLLRVHLRVPGKRHPAAHSKTAEEAPQPAVPLRLIEGRPDIARTACENRATSPYNGPTRYPARAPAPPKSTVPDALNTSIRSEPRSMPSTSSVLARPCQLGHIPDPGPAVPVGYTRVRIGLSSSHPFCGVTFGPQ